MKFRRDDKIDYNGLNEIIDISRKILRIALIFIIIVGIYVILKLCNALGLKPIIVNILTSIFPLFVGLFMAWLFDPIVSYLQKKGWKRGLGATLVYVVFLGVIGVIVGLIIPMLGNQINDFVKTLPSIFNSIKDWIDNVFDGLKGNNFINMDNIKNGLFSSIENFGVNLTQSLPNMVVTGVKALFSGVGSFVVGLIIGFYFLISYNNFGDTIITLVPKKFQKDARRLITEVNTSFRKFINGSIIDCTLVFVLSTIALTICGVKAPLLFGLFCGITNIIPFAGPYIGGAPAIIVGFCQSPTIGIFALISIAVIQTIEGNFLQPIILGKTTKLHPVTIILGLLVFSKFFGILGMVISTPVIGAVKAIYLFFDEKYHFFDKKEKNEE